MRDIWKQFCKNPVVKFLASLKLAVVVILSMTALMIWGTFTESSFNATFAKWRVYQSVFFQTTLAFLFINILFAALVRFPYKKRLAGFYIIHLGLLMLLIGSAITMIFGIDGNIRLLPNKTTNAVIINEPQFYAFYSSNDKSHPLEIIRPLPKIVKPYENTSKPFASLLDYDIYLKRFLPFASPKYSWKPHPDTKKKTRLIGMELANENFNQTVELSNLDSKSLQKKLGLLNFSYYPRVPHSCFDKALKQKNKKYLLITSNQCQALNDITSKVQTVGGIQIKIEKTLPFLKLNIKIDDKTSYNIYPKLSSYPINEELNIQTDAPISLINLDSLRNSPQLVFFSNDKLGFGKGTDWKYHPIEMNKDINLPWMGFKLTINRLIDNKYMHTEWYYHAPRGDSVRSTAALLLVKNRYKPEDQHEFWADDAKIKKIQTKKGLDLQFMLGNKIHYLPFKLELSKFKMDTNPGTNSPASYESYVKAHDLLESDEAHIYMNNPLKKGKFTFYQASYFLLEDGQNYGSVLSVNYDPGRITKYTGSLLLVFGSILHFVIRSRKKKKTSSLRGA
jgi:hypothetical protein